MDLRRDVDVEKDAFFMECAQDVTMRDQLAILQRSFQTKNQVLPIPSKKPTFFVKVFWRRNFKKGPLYNFKKYCLGS